MNLFNPVNEDYDEHAEAIKRVNMWWHSYHESTVAKLSAQIDELKAKIKELEKCKTQTN